MPRHTVTLTISLPPDMAREVEKARKAEHRTSSELWREAMRAYLRSRNLPVYTPTAAELRALQRGRAEIGRGDYLTLDELRASLATDRPQASAKNSRPRSSARTRKAPRRT